MEKLINLKAKFSYLVTLYKRGLVYLTSLGYDVRKLFFKEKHLVPDFLDKDVLFNIKEKDDYTVKVVKYISNFLDTFFYLSKMERENIFNTYVRFEYKEVKLEKPTYDNIEYFNRRCLSLFISRFSELSNTYSI